jgi:hypothetical protein
MGRPAARLLGIAAAFILASAGPALASGARYQDGLAAYRRNDFKTSIKILTPLAEHGDARAQYVLGRQYQFGQGVKIDRAAAYYWYRRAEAKGHLEARLFRVLLEKRWKLSAADKARALRQLAALKQHKGAVEARRRPAPAARPPVTAVAARPQPPAKPGTIAPKPPLRPAVAALTPRPPERSNGPAAHDGQRTGAGPQDRTSRAPDRTRRNLAAAPQDRSPYAYDGGPMEDGIETPPPSSPPPAYRPPSYQPPVETRAPLSPPYEPGYAPGYPPAYPETYVAGPPYYYAPAAPPAWTPGPYAVPGPRYHGHWGPRARRFVGWRAHRRFGMFRGPW